jgi:hypothetical protein
MDSKYFLLLSALLLLPARPAQARVLAGVAWPVRPAVVIDGVAGDARVPLVQDGARW